MHIPNIKYKGDLCKTIENASDKFETIAFCKDIDFFYEAKSYKDFIKSCEAQVRKSKDYSKFISYIKETLGINFCQISSQIYTEKEVTIEMHHGPLFTLYDYCAVILNKFIEEHKKITTFRIVDKIIDEHYALRVQVVMATITNHEGVHNRDIFLNVKQGIGNISEFINKYSKYLNDDQKYRIYRYIKLCEEVDSFDNGILDIEHIEKLIEI